MKIIYSAIVLTEDGKNELLDKCPAIHSNVFGHHMTIQFGKDTPVPENLGETVTLKVVGVGADDKGQAVVVDGDTTNKIPHITVSCADGTKPVYSNELLANGYESVEPFEVTGIVKVFTPDGWVDERDCFV